MILELPDVCLEIGDGVVKGTSRIIEVALDNSLRNLDSGKNDCGEVGVNRLDSGFGDSVLEPHPLATNNVGDLIDGNGGLRAGEIFNGHASTEEGEDEACYFHRECVLGKSAGDSVSGEPTSCITADS